ncbi:hypothetical protein EVAR_87595_1 [Eumeta japonica]|uniref:Uncharacterized protein n=1 Tax=Eumeta variegata TaxID=151549 RepID=A0A4C1WMY0_EUMVA|nr:hypothetical protein EVAR_87595_1 [Eumeta japonica]
MYHMASCFGDMLGMLKEFSFFKSGPFTQYVDCDIVLVLEHISTILFGGGEQEFLKSVLVDWTIKDKINIESSSNV